MGQRIPILILVVALAATIASQAWCAYPAESHFSSLRAKAESQQTRAVSAASSPAADLWITNGEVRTLLPVGDQLFIGGNFTVVGPPTGGAGLVDAETGALRKAPLDMGYGSVFAACPDGAGGWFIGGSFSTIRRHPRANLAHIGPDGELLGWAPEPNGEIRSLVLSEGTLFVGGTFTIVGGQARRCIAALDPGTGTATDWNP